MYHTQHASCWLSLCPERRTPPCCSVMKPPMLLAPLANRKMNIKCSSCFRFESHGRRTLSVWQLANLKKQEIIINSRIVFCHNLQPDLSKGIKDQATQSAEITLCLLPVWKGYSVLIIMKRRRNGDLIRAAFLPSPFAIGTVLTCLRCSLTPLYTHPACLADPSCSRVHLCTERRGKKRSSS